MPNLNKSIYFYTKNKSVSGNAIGFVSGEFKIIKFNNNEYSAVIYDY